MMKKSKYMKYMTESYIYEAEEFKARSKESGKIVYYKTKDAMDAAIKDKKSEPIEKGGEEKPDEPKAEPKTTAISKTGGLGGDDEEGGEEPSGEEKPVGEMSDEELGDAAQQASDEYDTARNKADDVAMRTGNTDSDEHKAAEAAYTKVTDTEAELKKRKKPGEMSGEEPSSDQEVPDNEEDWAKEMGYDGGPIEDEYSESKEDYEDSQNPKYADDFSDEEKAEIEKRWKGAQKKYNAYVKKGVEKGWLDKDGFRDGLKVAFAGIPDEGDEQGRTGTEEIKVINGKKYKPIKESIDKRISVKEVRSWLKGLEEFRYRKIPGVDARRITSFVNNGLSETDLPASLQKKWGNAKYSREKHLADKFVKERISRKLARNESNHPLKEQYNKLFKNKVVL